MEETSLQVLYRDQAVMVCLKPPGVLSEPGAGRNLPALAASYLQAKGLEGQVRTVHRLDRDVGGLMVLALSAQAAASLTGQIRDRDVTKEYYAVTQGIPAQESAVLEDLLFHDRNTNKTFVVQRQRKGVRPAALSYRVLQSLPEAQLSLLRIRLYTGRTHQIRAQLAARGLPLWGDVRYGSRNTGGPIALWSCTLEFVHPQTGRRMSFYAKPTLPEPWSRFSAQVYTSVSNLPPLSRQNEEVLL